MTSPWAACLSPVFGFVGMALLSLAMDRHFGQVFSRRAPSRALCILLRVVGALGLVMALVFALDAWGPSVGWVAWLGWLTVGALVVAWMLAYAIRLLLGLVVLGTAVLTVSVSLLLG
ncbi:DUF3325 domain-containing protein [Pigmentiphaga litoralis]|uniref:DUF3325 domain-containing protein n=1 Tax=Pigmentiphaga litoralis TaxID=516702 RepID=UPI003B43042F